MKGLCTLACGFCLSAVVAATAPSCGWNGETADWMKFLPDGVALAEIMMPASHDGAMIEGCGKSISWLSNDAIPLFINQAVTVGEQFAAGSRYVELRPMFGDDNELYSSHCTYVKILKASFGGTGESFVQVFREAKSFLAAHPSEVVFFNIWRWSYAYGGDAKMETKIRTAVKDLMDRDEFKSMFYRWTGASGDCPSVNAIRLGDVRGKVIAIWEDTTPDAANGIWGHQDVGPAAPGRLAVSRRGSDTDNVDNLVKDQLSIWAGCKDWDPVELAYAASFELTWQFSLFDLKNSNLKLSKKANPRLKDFLSTGVAAYGKGMLIYTDYVTADTACEIIAYNFPLPASGGGALPLPPRPRCLTAAGWASLQERFEDFGIGTERVWDLADWVERKAGGEARLLGSEYLRASFDLGVAPMDDDTTVTLVDVAGGTGSGFSFRIRVDGGEFVCAPAERLAPYIRVVDSLGGDWRVVDVNRLKVEETGEVIISRKSSLPIEFVRLSLPTD